MAVMFFKRCDADLLLVLAEYFIGDRSEWQAHPPIFFFGPPLLTHA